MVMPAMIIGSHVVIYSTDPAADRKVFHDVFGWPSVDAGGDWLIFSMPPAEVAVHPAQAAFAEVYLMSDDLPRDIQRLEASGLATAEVERPRWGSVTRFRLPGGAEIGLYQPSHPSPVASVPADG
jgi:predicted enzyme related to lactoylglutathione lyase